MNPFKRVLQGLTGQQMTTTNNKPRKRVIGAIDISTPEDRVKMEMKTLVDAVDAAIYPGRPDRRELIAIYRRSVTDPHVISQFDTSISKLVGEQFIVSRGEVDAQTQTIPKLQLLINIRAKFWCSAPTCVLVEDSLLLPLLIHN